MVSLLICSSALPRRHYATQARSLSEPECWLHGKCTAMSQQQRQEFQGYLLGDTDHLVLLCSASLCTPGRQQPCRGQRWQTQRSFARAEAPRRQSSQLHGLHRHESSRREARALLLDVLHRTKRPRQATEAGLIEVRPLRPLCLPWLPSGFRKPAGVEGADGTRGALGCCATAADFAALASVGGRLEGCASLISPWGCGLRGLELISRRGLCANDRFAAPAFPCAGWSQQAACEYVLSAP
eukprot:2384044-Pleurochrysis_carterae.AAC.2